MEIKRNYQIEMERQIGRMTGAGKKPLLVLHSCCAPCSSAVLERLNDFFRICVYYYNPNIAPEAEFRLRATEQARLIAQMPLADVQMEEGPYDGARYYEQVRGHEGDREGGGRCAICFEMRLRKTAEFARKMGADCFTTTLTISPLKNARLLNEIGERIAKETGLVWLFSDFKKKDGYRRSIELSEEYGLYRQNYCGCIFSRRTAEED